MDGDGIARAVQAYILFMMFVAALFGVGGTLFCVYVVPFVWHHLHWVH